MAQLASDLRLPGVLMDAEQPNSSGGFFQGGQQEAAIYATRLRERLDAAGRTLAVCSHDIPDNFLQFLFVEFAAAAPQNAPQVCYGSSPSVQNRLDRALRSNADVDLPLVPVGAAWPG